MLQVGIPKRITNAPAGSFIMPEYSTICPFSKDNKYLLLTHQDHYELYTGEGDWIEPLPMPADSEPKWSRHDPNLLYYRKFNEVWLMNVATAQFWLQHRFSSSISVSGRGESDISEDGKHLVLADDSDVWIYNIETDQVLSRKPWTVPYNSLYVTPGNDALVGQNLGGVFLLSDGRKVAPMLAHHAVGRDVDGSEILVRFSGDQLADGSCKNGIEKVKLATGIPACIWALGWLPQEEGGGPASFAGHVSCPDGQPWVLISIYSPKNARKSSIWKAWLDGSKQEHVCDTGSVMMLNAVGGMAYNPTPRAAVSRDGSRAVFASNGGDTSRGPNYCDAFIVGLAVTETPNPDPVPNPDAVFRGWTPVNFDGFVPGQEWLWHFKFDGRQLLVQAYDKDGTGRR